MSAELPFIAPERFEVGAFVIRTYFPGDGTALQRAVVESYEHLSPWMPWAKPDQTVEESEAICRRGRASYLLNQDFLLGVWEGERVIGGTGFHLRFGPIESHIAEIGMWIHPAFAGQGLGTRVLRAMLEWGFTDWGWDRLVWKCDTRNIASRRLAEKCGLTLEGTLRSDAHDVEGQKRSTHLFAMLREEWPASR
jgi:RimJ/RimL family protein N-acetyltransferase